MNEAAKKLLGFDHEKENISLVELVKPEYKSYSKDAFKKLYQEGMFSNYKVKLITKDKK